MFYSELTFKDKNPIKRWLQHQRLESAIKQGLYKEQSPSVIVDFGAGNGELCKLLIELYPKSRIICYEPTPKLLNEARVNLAGISCIEFIADINKLDNNLIDIVYCLEVFEHLPLEVINKTIKQILKLLKNEGVFIIGVPNEVGIPALYKGIFRMTRRFGAFDANIKNVFLSFIGFPPSNRPKNEITPGFEYHPEHLGFDFRNLKNNLCQHFNKFQISASPFNIFGAWLMPEIYFTISKKSFVGYQDYKKEQI